MKSEQVYIKKPVVKLTGKETFKNTGTKKFSILEFWQYGFSNLNSNVLRGVLAEFLLECALKDNLTKELRNPWGDFDVLYKGKKIEVKCSSYLQDWNQHKLSTIRWSGLKASSLYWSSAELKPKQSKEKSYKSDMYVLAFVHHTDTETLDLLDLNQWSFFILSKEELGRISKNGNSISLARLNKEGCTSVPFSKLSEYFV